MSVHINYKHGAKTMKKVCIFILLAMGLVFCFVGQSPHGQSNSDIFNIHIDVS